MNQTEISTRETPIFFENLFRKKLIQRLGTLPRGHLVIEDAEETYSCGRINQASEITARMTIHDTSAYRDIA